MHCCSYIFANEILDRHMKGVCVLDSLVLGINESVFIVGIKVQEPQGRE